MQAIVLPVRVLNQYLKLVRLISSLIISNRRILQAWSSKSAYFQVATAVCKAVSQGSFGAYFRLFGRLISVVTKLTPGITSLNQSP